MSGELLRRLGLNDEQARAVSDTGHDVLISAGAGTGKTRVLVSRYLRLILEDGFRPAGVAAITFTNKAAAEMRDRIRNSLLELAADYPPASALIEELNWAPIQTIHSFCADLLRGQPLLAGVPLGFTLLEEGEAALLLAEAGEEALIEVMTASPEPPGLAEALVSFGRRRLLESVAETLLDLPRWGLDASAMRVEDGLSGLPTQAARELREWYREFLASPAPVGLAPGTFAAAAELRRLGPEIDEGLDLLARGEEPPILDELAGLLSDLRAGSFKDLAAPGKEALRAARQALAARRAELMGPGYLALVRTAARLYAAAKGERSSLDFADLEIKTRDLLRLAGQGARIAARYPQILVDEFQDTNPLQWQIIESLWQSGSRLFAVGDVKQSIYRFRGADVRVMENLRRVLEAGRGRVYSLQENYRCRPQLAALVNQVCDPLLSAQTVYEPLRAQRDGSGPGPRVQALIVPGDRLDRAAEAAGLAALLQELILSGPLIVDPETGQEHPLRPGDIALLFRASTNIYQYEQALRAAGLPFRVLAGSGFYERDEVADLRHLLAVVENPGDAVALAAVLRSPLFDVSDAGLYRLAGEGADLVEGFVRADLRELALGDDLPRLEHARRLLADLHARRPLADLGELLVRALADTGYYTLQSAFPDYRQRLANLEKLLRVAMDYRAQGRGEVGEFLAYLKSLDNLAVREGEAPLAGGGEAILLLTVHRAKGLEFPLVCLPDLGRAPGGSRPEVLTSEDGRVGFRFGKADEGRTTPLWQTLNEQAGAAEEEESKRLLYVALTRARDYLILTGSSAGRGANWLSWLQEGLGIAPGDRLIEQAWGSLRLRAELRPAAAEGLRPPVRLFPAIRRGGPAGALAEVAASSEAPARAMTYPAPRPLLTVTAALAYRQCPRRYYLRYVLGLSEAKPAGGTGGGGAELGTVLHRLAARLVQGSRPSAEDLEAGGEEVRADLERLLANYEAGRSYRGALAAARVWSEYEFLLRLDQGALAGTADLLWLDAQGVLNLADLKTNRVVMPSPALLAEHRWQLQCYTLALRRLFHRVAASGRIEYLWPNMDVEVPLGEDALAAVEGEIEEILRFLGQSPCYEDFVARVGEGCRWCGFTCPGSEERTRP